MELVIVVLLAVILSALLLVWLQTNRRLNRLDERGLSQEQLDALAQRLLDSDQRILATTTQTFGELQSNLGQLSQATKQMMEVGKDIASLEDLLKPPKLRGGMGETLLEMLLAQIFRVERFYELQYRFRSGESVDAVIKLGENLVPVDAKFPLESFRRILEGETEGERRAARREFIKVVKNHIDNIAQKYILPDEGTFDFALMYIPAENVYYETIIKGEGEEGIFPYALERRVIPVSPNSFYAYLQVIVRGLRGLQIEERAQEIMVHLERLQGDFDRFHQDFETLGTHIQHARSKYEEADRKLERLGDKLTTIGEAEREELPPPEVAQLEQES